MVRCLGLISNARMVVFPYFFITFSTYQRRSLLQQDFVNIH